jgi:hypothetical protein
MLIFDYQKRRTWRHRVTRHILLLPIIVYLSQSFAGTNDSYLSKELAITAGYDKGMDEFGYPLPAKTETCHKLRLLRTVSEPSEVFSIDGSLPACVDSSLAQFMESKSTVCAQNNCGNTYPGGCEGLLERVFPYDEDYYQMIELCRDSGAE